MMLRSIAALWLIAAAVAASPQPLSLSIAIDTLRPVAMTSPDYIGVNIDSGAQLTGWPCHPHPPPSPTLHLPASLYNRMDFTDANLAAVLQNLSPLILRIGGGTADSLVFSPGPPTGNTSVIDGPYWDSIVAFVRRTGVQLVFDLSCLQLRTPTGAWDPSNTQLFFQYLQTHNQTDAIYALELGNEPAHFYFHHNRTSGPNATQLAADYRTLHALLRTTFHPPPLIFGPDLCCNYTGYLDEFLAALGPGVLDAVTVHSYPLQGPKNNATGECTVEEFLNGTLLDRSGEEEADFSANTSQSSFAPGRTRRSPSSSCRRLCSRPPRR